MTANMKHARGVLVGTAVVAVLFGLVHTPLTVSAMHAGMMENFSMETHAESDCTRTDCSPESVCLQHCLEQATSHDSEVVQVSRVQVHVPATTSQRTTYPKEDEDPVHADQIFSHTSARDILLTTHKRE